VIRKRVVAHGNVQGVFFRDATQREAKSAGVAGWVRNRSDGAVEAVFEGDDDAVERMVSFVRSGPGHADVDDVEVSDEEPEGLDGFGVR
jgi:acylphosphatase